MLTYAYRLRSIRFLEGDFKADTLRDFYEYLALKLSGFVLNRYKKGLYREYISEQAELSYICGRMDLRTLIRKPWTPKIEVEYQEYTSDVEMNQIITYALDMIARSGFCSKRTLPIIHSAYRTMLKYSQIKPYRGSDCENLLYNRLNQDYEPLHLLCRFFLDHLGPR